MLQGQKRKAHRLEMEGHRLDTDNQQEGVSTTVSTNHVTSIAICQFSWMRFRKHEFGHRCHCRQRGPDQGLLFSWMLRKARQHPLVCMLHSVRG